MRIAICYPPLPSEKGVPLLSQNRQFQWFSRPTYIFPVVPATAATMLKKAGHDVLFLDGIAAELTDEAFFVGVQYHPEFRSRPNKPHPLFIGFVGAAAQRC